MIISSLRWLGAISMASLLVACGGGDGKSASAAVTTTQDSTEPAAAPGQIVCTTFVSRGVTEHIAHVTLPAGTVELGPQVDSDLVANASSLGVQDGYLVTCANTVVRVGIADGKAETTDVACDAVTADDGAIWVVANNQLTEYTDFAAVKAHTRVSSVAVDEHAVNRIASAGDGTLVGAAYQATAVVHVTPATGKTSAPLELASFAGMILGVATVDDGRVVVAPWNLGGGLFVFDGASGAQLHAPDATTTNELFHGLSCTSH
jgi:hypothetical protein